MLILNVIVLIIVSAITGYFIGKGKIVVEKRLDKETSERVMKEQEQVIEQYNNMMQSLGGGINE